MASQPLQEIICCLGHPVAGNPTQYVMEQAFAAANLDCRCLTLDVSPEHLGAAIDGMQAMGFRGAIIAAPHEAQVGNHLGESQGRSMRYVDLVHRESDQWQGEFSLGLAIRELVGMRIERDPETAIVLGDGPRGLAIAEDLALAGIGTTVVPSELRSAPTDTEEGLAENANNGAKHGVRYVALDQLEAMDIGADLVVQTERIELPAWQLGDRKTRIAVDIDRESLRTDFLRAAKEAECQVVDGIAIQVHQLMTAFSRWTQAQAEEQVMREAIEEFLLV